MTRGVGFFHCLPWHLGSYFVNRLFWGCLQCLGWGSRCWGCQLRTEDGRVAMRKIIAWKSIPVLPHLPCSSQLQGIDILRIPGCRVRWAVILGGYPKPQGACTGAGHGVGGGKRCRSKWDGRNSTLAPCQRQRALLGAAAFPGTAGSQMVCLSVYMDLWGCGGGKPLSRDSAIKADGGRLIWFLGGHLLVL